jgi:hypothetical protein
MTLQPLTRTILRFGCAAGGITIGSAILGLTLSGGDGTHLGALEWLGYLVMILALSLVLVGVKRYRDTELGGVIRFGRAFLVGLGISFVAGVIYVAAWEVYLALTDYAFIEQYAASVIAARESAGAEAAELAELAAEMAVLQQRYASVLFRVPMTFAEIFPVGVLVSLLAGAVLRTHGKTRRT